MVISVLYIIGKSTDPFHKKTNSLEYKREQLTAVYRGNIILIVYQYTIVETTVTAVSPPRCDSVQSL